MVPRGVYPTQSIPWLLMCWLRRKGIISHVVDILSSSKIFCNKHNVYDNFSTKYSLDGPYHLTDSDTLNLYSHRHWLLVKRRKLAPWSLRFSLASWIYWGWWVGLKWKSGKVYVRMIPVSLAPGALWKLPFTIRSTMWRCARRRKWSE